MLFGITRFEIRYQLRNPVFWVAIAIFFLLGFGLTASENVSIGTPGSVKENSPYAISIATAILTLFYLFVVTAFVANAIVRATKMVASSLAVLAISGTELECATRDAGVAVFSEIYADRGYLPSGRLVPRKLPGAMIHDPAAAAQRLVEFLSTGLMPTVDGPPIKLEAHSICVHGDSEGALALARHVRSELAAAGIAVASFLPTVMEA